MKGEQVDLSRLDINENLLMCQITMQYTQTSGVKPITAVSSLTLQTIHSVISITFREILLRSTTTFDEAETRQKSSRVFLGVWLVRIMRFRLNLIILDILRTSVTI